MLPLEPLYRRVPLIFGHRGAPAVAPENTLAAFERALALGADGVELDVTLSADGVPVVIHDDTLDRTTDGTGRVAAHTLAELKRLDAGCARRFGREHAGERIPTLAEVLERVGARAILNVELKHDRTPGARLAAAVVDLLEAHNLAGRVIVSSFQLRTLRAVRQLAPGLAIAPLYNRPASAALVAGNLNRALCPATPPEAHHPGYAGLTAERVRCYHVHGYRVNTWTVNEAGDMRRLLELGVDGIITDRPELAVECRGDSRLGA